MNLYVKKEALDDFLDGNKIYELRLSKTIFKHINVGDNLILKDSKRELSCNVEEIYSFNSLEHVFNTLDYNDFNSRTNNKEETINLYKNIYPIIKAPILVFKLKKHK